MSISTGAAAVPADFKALKFAYFDDTPVQLLRWVPINELYAEYPDRSVTETPCVISREGTNFIFGPDSKDGTLKGIYYAKQDPLETTDNSWYVVNASDALVYGAMMEAALFIKDPEMYNFWRPQFEETVRTLQEEEYNSGASFGSLAQRTA